MESTGLFALLLVPIISLDIKIFQKADNVWISLLDFLTFQSCKQFSHSGHGIGCSVEKYPLFISILVRLDRNERSFHGFCRRFRRFCPLIRKALIDNHSRPFIVDQIAILYLEESVVPQPLN